MNTLKNILLVAGVAAISIVPAGAQGLLTLNFSSVPGATIQFNGSNSNFVFNTSKFGGPNGYFYGSQFQVGSQDGGTDSAIGLLGSADFNNSLFSYGYITTVISSAGIDQSATVTGPSGAFVIRDGSGFNLTGNIDWVKVSTHDYAGAINAALSLNLTGLSYSGANADLIQLANNGPAALDLTFQFSPGKTLADLTSGSGTYSTSFSGSLTVVPEPSTMACLVAGLSVLTVAARRGKQNSRA